MGLMGKIKWDNLDHRRYLMLVPALLEEENLSFSRCTYTIPSGIDDFCQVVLFGVVQNRWSKLDITEHGSGGPLEAWRVVNQEYRQCG